MDASTHANRKGDEKQRNDEKKQGGDKGRYEGGRDSDQNRQAKGDKGRQGDAGTPTPAKPEGRGGGEEE